MRQLEISGGRFALGRTRQAQVAAGILAASILVGCGERPDVSVPDIPEPEATVTQTVTATPTAPAPPAMPGGQYGQAGMERVGPGMSGSAVQRVQGLLIAINCLPSGSDDGEYGDQTGRAVETAQRELGLDADGWVFTATWPLLISNATDGTKVCDAPIQDGGEAPAPPPPSDGIPNGCPPKEGPASPGTVCPDGSIPVKDPNLPYGCIGTSKIGPGAPGTVCPARPGRPEYTL